MNPEDLVNGVLRSVLGGRGKRSGRAVRYLTRDLSRGMGQVARGVGRATGSVNRHSGGFLTRPSTLLGALGIAWGIFESLQHQPAAGAPGAPAQGGWGPGTPPPVPPQGASSAPGVQVPPIPNVAPPAAPSPDAMRMVRLAVSAAHADGPMNEQEREAILVQARNAGIEAVFGPEMMQPRPLAEIVAGVSEAADRATLYVLAYTVLRADEHVTGAERIYLAQLGHLLGLDAPTVAKLEADTSQRIDTSGGQEPRDG